jgi:Holliday junction resolvase RusA-like endonuclease
MRSKTYCINVSPISWQRAGMNKARFFDKQVQDKIAVGLLLRKQHGNDPLFDGPLGIDIIFYIKHSKVKPKPLVKWHFTTPDVDNFLKFIFDAMRSVVMVDDRLFSQVNMTKVYDMNPRTEFTIRELE